jgi:hypothetical protein
MKSKTGIYAKIKEENFLKVHPIKINDLWKFVPWRHKRKRSKQALLLAGSTITEILDEKVR